GKAGVAVVQSVSNAGVARSQTVLLRSLPEHPKVVVGTPGRSYTTDVVLPGLVKLNLRSPTHECVATSFNLTCVITPESGTLRTLLKPAGELSGMANPTVEQ